MSNVVSTMYKVFCIYEQQSITHVWIFKKIVFVVYVIDVYTFSCLVTYLFFQILVFFLLSISQFYTKLKLCYIKTKITSR